MRIRTFPDCEVFYWRAEYGQSIQSVGNSTVPLQIPRPSGLSTTLYFAYTPEQKAAASRSLSFEDRESLFVKRILKDRDCEQPAYPTGFPILVLNDGSGMVYFLTHQPIYWMVPSLLLVGAILAWRRRRTAEIGQPTAPPVTRLGRFELGRSLGKGGAGEVFEARDDRGERVAVKVLHANLEEDELAHKRFLREVRVCSQINHPHVVKLLDWGQHGNCFYLVMELLEGESLGQLLRRQGKLTPEELLELLKPLAAALQTLHDQGIVHRDIKPDNIFLRKLRGPALMDFGIAAGRDLTRATVTGISLGTPTYMAPEQIAGQAVAASDQYSLGVLAFMCLTGRRPFEAEDALGMVYQHLHAGVPLVSSLEPALPRGIDAVLLKTMSKSPSERYTSVTEAVQRLGDAISLPAFAEEATIETEL